MKILSGLVLSLFLVPFLASAAAPKVYIQWAQSNPNDWTLIDSSVWPNQPTKSDPSDVSNGSIIGDSLLNNQKGWVFALNVQGVIFNWYDHYALEANGETIIVTAWRTDPILFPFRQADVGIFKPLKWDAKVGQDNTDQTFILYREGTEYNANNPQHRPYSEFIEPSTSVVKHGIFISDNKWNEHINAETLKGWRE